MFHRLSPPAAPKTALDALLDELQSLVDTWLPIIAPIIGIPERDALAARKDFDHFVADVEALEHGQVDTTDGVVKMIDDLLEFLRHLGLDYNAPSELG